MKAWAEPVDILTYAPMPPDKNPMFLENRVYQGSSGRVYPLPFIDRISTTPELRSWQAIHLENEFLRIMVLPEIGGRIHVGLDKTNGYDFFYRQNVIKPALVGLAGPWISGGVEFNWPQHHRPATFMPVSSRIEEHGDGSRTVWCGDHDPMNRLKGMHGVCLRPGRAYIELKVRLYNRTPLVQTFLWWANVGTRVHEKYQSFFPPDVHYVADHARRAMSTFPLCESVYYGVDYGARAQEGVPADELPRRFVPNGSYPPNDLSWYSNIPVPTSYMAMGSRGDFFGGYDHARQAGVIHFANHHISPGKKQWTWGNHEFGYAWDRNLSDDEGPYVELMAGVYTDNQPDFSFLMPGETKTFSQFWYPIQMMGPAQKGNIDAAISLQVTGETVRAAVCVSGPFAQAVVSLEQQGNTIVQWSRDLVPGTPMIEKAELPTGVQETDLTMRVRAADGRELIRYTPQATENIEIPLPATEASFPEEIASNDELFVTGLHLDQYRHTTRNPESYWLEALRRDPGDARCNDAMGSRHLRRGEFAKAEEYFRAAIARLTQRNPNPYDGEPFYNLGLTLRYVGRDDDAYASFYKATWNHAWRAASYYALAELNAKRSDWNTALEHLKLCLGLNSDHLNARDLAVVVLRKLGKQAEAEDLLAGTLRLDPLDCWANYLSSGTLPSDNQIRLDLAFDYARAGIYDQAVETFDNSDRRAIDGSAPMIMYALGYFKALSGHVEAARKCYSEGAGLPRDYCFPSRLEEMIVLQAAIQANSGDASAAYYLGNLFYDRRRYTEAIDCWECSARLNDSFPTVWRNLGIAYYNVLADAERARSAFDRAWNANPTDVRVLYERDQLWKRIGTTPSERLAEIRRYKDLATSRDDLAVELAALYNQTGQPGKALELLTSRRFQPWEGGEGLALGQHVRSYLALGRRSLANGDALEAIRLFETALVSPENLGEAKHLLTNQSNLYYWLGAAYRSMEQEPMARQWWREAAEGTGDFQDMTVKAYSEMTFYNAMALRRLGNDDEAERLFSAVMIYAEQLSHSKPRLDYFATSLPAMLLFNDDLERRNSITATFLQAQASFGLGREKRASELLEEVLALDPNHGWAAEFREELGCEALLSETDRPSQSREAPCTEA